MPSSAFQLVRSGAGKRELVSVESAHSKRDVPHAERPGSQGLLSLVQALSAVGYVPIRFTFVDRTLSALEPSTAEHLSTRLIDLVNSKDVDGLHHYILNEMSGIFVLDATLRDEYLGQGTVKLSQDGLVKTHSIAEAERLPQVISEVG